MAKNDKYDKIKESDFFDYFEGNLSGRKRNAFERRLQKDLFDSDAAEGFSMVSREEAREDLQSVSRKVRRRISKTRRITWYGVAAALVSILIVTTIFLNVSDTSMNMFHTAPEMKEAGREQPAIPLVTEEDVAAVPDESGTGPELPENRDSEGVVAGQPDRAAELGAGAPGTAEGILFEMEDADQDLEIVEEEMAAKKGSEEVVADEDDREAEDHAFAWERMEEDAERFRTEQEKRSASKAITQAPATTIDITEAATGTATPGTLQGRLAGVIRSADDLEPIPGVSVLVKGTDVGTVTDHAGNFSLNVEGVKGNTLVASFVGMEREEIPINADKPVEIAMLPSSQSLDEVVVVGYGTSEKTALTGAGTTLHMDNTVSEFSYATPEMGIAAYKQYIDSNLIYPPDAASTEDAVVVLKFSVSPEGRPQNFTIIRSPSESFSNESIRVIKNGPDWTPASRDGNYTGDTMRLRVVFEID